MTSPEKTRDIVTTIIKECHNSKAIAETLFNAIANKKQRTLRIANQEITITEAEAGEFVERFSAEVEPTLWESKRRKN
ncbi:MAG: hypothetical protein P8X63_07730 [Desulfuromonadaceae bacterium]